MDVLELLSTINDRLSSIILLYIGIKKITALISDYFAQFLFEFKVYLSFNNLFMNC